MNLKKKSVLWTRLAYVLVILVTVGYYGYTREKDSAISPDAHRPVTGDGVGIEETDSTAPSGQSRRFAVKGAVQHNYSTTPVIQESYLAIIGE